MNRRNLLKGAAGIFGSLFLPKVLLANIDPFTSNHVFSNEFKKRLKQIAHYTDQRINEHGLRRLLMEDELKNGELAKYIRGTNNNALVWCGERRDKKIKGYNDIMLDRKGLSWNKKFNRELIVDKDTGEEHWEHYVCIPSFQIPSTHKEYTKFVSKFSNEKEVEKKQEQYMHDLVCRYTQKENEIIIDLLEAASMSNRKQTVYAKKTEFNLSNSYYARDMLNHAFRNIEQHDLVVCNCVMHPSMAYHLINQKSSKDFMDINTDKKTNDILFGHLWTADIIAVPECPQDTMYFTTEPSNMGAFPIRQSLTIIPTMEKGKIVLYDFEEVGAAIINDFSVSKIKIGTKESKKEKLKMPHHSNPRIK